MILAIGSEAERLYEGDDSKGLTRNEEVGIAKCCKRSDPTWCLN
jgi:hypothetical protein